MLLKEFHKSLEKDPSDRLSRMALADYYTESNQYNLAKIHRWLSINNRFPLFLPATTQDGFKVGWQTFFRENSTIINRHSLPDEIFCLLPNPNLICKHDSKNIWMGYYKSQKDFDISMEKSFSLVNIDNIKAGEGIFKSPLKNLHLQLRMQTGSGYGEGDVEKLTMDDFIDRCRFGTAGYLSVLCKIDDWNILVLDLDNGGFDYTSDFLHKNQIPYALFESTPKKYWFILDIVSKDFALIDSISDSIHHQDKRYTRFSRYRKTIHIRGEFRNDKPPVLIANNLESYLSKKFLELFINHWLDPRVALANKLKKEKPIDFSFSY
jgi:hypothetical protein